MRRLNFQPFLQNKNVLWTLAFIVVTVVTIGLGLSSDSLIQIGMIWFLIVVVILLGSSIKICQPTDKFVIVRWGGDLLKDPRGPGPTFVYWFLGEVSHPINMQAVPIDPPATSLVTKDRIPIMLDPIANWQVVNAPTAWKNWGQLDQIIHNAIQDKIQETLGSHDLEFFLNERTLADAEIRSALDEFLIKDYGVIVKNVGFQTIKYPKEIDEMMTQRAAAEREAEATRINSAALLQSAKDLTEADDLLQNRPHAMELMRLRIQERIASGSNKIVVMVPTSALDYSVGASLANLAQLSPPQPTESQKNGGAPKEPTTTDPA